MRIFRGNILRVRGPRNNSNNASGFIIKINLVSVKRDKTNGLEVDTVFQCHQIRALDKGRLTRGPVGSLSQNDLSNLNKAIRFSMGL
jgi:hypothetical protein